MASAVTPPQQLAPTVGPAAAPAGVFIRTGSIGSSGVRVVSGLVHRFGSLSFVSDNAGCLGNNPLPRNGSIINFGDHEVYVATEFVRHYPRKVVLAEDPPSVCAARGRHSSCPASCVEVMVTAPAADAGKGDAGDGEAGRRTTRSARPPLERAENLAGQAGPSNTPVRPNPLRATIEKLAVPVVSSTDVVLTQIQLEEQRQYILQEAIEVARIRQEFDISLREYNIAHGFTPVANNPSRMNDVRARGKNLNAEIARDGRSKSSVSPSLVSDERPKYSTPAKNLRAAGAAAAELSTLSGEALHKQQIRVNELLIIANRQNEAYLKAHAGAAGSQRIHSAGGAGG